MTLETSRTKISDYDKLVKEESDLVAALALTTPVVTIQINGTDPTTTRGSNRLLETTTDLKETILTALEDRLTAVQSAKADIESEFS